MRSSNLPFQVTSVPFFPVPVRKIRVRAGVALLKACGNGPFGPDHDLAALGAAAAVAAPSAQTVPAAATSVASLDIGRLSIIDPHVLLIGCLPRFGQAGSTLGAGTWQLTGENL